MSHDIGDSNRRSRDLATLAISTSTVYQLMTHSPSSLLTFQVHYSPLMEKAALELSNLEKIAFSWVRL